MPEYRRHAFEKEWHDKVEKFITENNLAFDSPKYFIKFCVNKYMDEYGSRSAEEEEMYEEAYKRFSQLVADKAEQLDENNENK